MYKKNAAAKALIMKVCIGFILFMKNPPISILLCRFNLQIRASSHQC